MRKMILHSVIFLLVAGYSSGADAQTYICESCSAPYKHYVAK